MRSNSDYLILIGNCKWRATCCLSTPREFDFTGDLILQDEEIWCKRLHGKSEYFRVKKVSTLPGVYENSDTFIFCEVAFLPNKMKKLHKRLQRWSEGMKLNM